MSTAQADNLITGISVLLPSLGLGLKEYVFSEAMTFPSLFQTAFSCEELCLSSCLLRSQCGSSIRDYTIAAQAVWLCGLGTAVFRKTLLILAGANGTY